MKPKLTIFGLEVPLHVPGVPDEVFQPRDTWADKEAYDKKQAKLAQKFHENFKRFPDASDDIHNAGPKLVK